MARTCVFPGCNHTPSSRNAKYCAECRVLQETSYGLVRRNLRAYSDGEISLAQLWHRLSNARKRARSRLRIIQADERTECLGSRNYSGHLCFFCPLLGDRCRTQATPPCKPSAPANLMYLEALAETEDLYR